MNDCLRAEWAKARTQRGLAWLLAGVVIVTVAMNVIGLSAARCPVAGCAQDPGRIGLVGVDLGQALVVVLAAVMIGGEYSSGMIGVSLAAVPNRTRLLAAKTVVVTALTGAASIVAVGASLLAAGILLPSRGFTAAHGYPSVIDAAMLRAAVGSVAYLMLIAALSCGVAWVVRDPTISTGTGLGLLYLFPVIGSALGQQWQRHLEQIAPMPAGLDIQATIGLRALPLSPLQGIGVVAAWSAATLLLSALSLERRDA